METAWKFGANVTTTDLVLGNWLAGLIGDDVGDNKSFRSGKRGINLRVSGSTGAATAWAVHTPLKARGYAAISELLSAGPYTNLNAIGITNEKVSEAKSKLSIEVGERYATENKLYQFISGLGYEIIPNE